MSASSSLGACQGNAFVTTHWSLVRAAGQSDSTHARDALEKLCRTYWYPIYAHVRRRGYAPEDAQDLTQNFFSRLLEGRSLANANPELGKFRSFLLGGLNHTLADESARSRAQKRGSGQPLLSLDLAAAEQRFELEANESLPPDLAFDRQWAAALLQNVLGRLQAEYESEGKGPLFRELQQTLVGTREAQPYAEIAARLGMQDGAIRTAVHRFRRRYREMIRAEIGSTVSTPAEIDDEMRYLLSVSVR